MKLSKDVRAALRLFACEIGSGGDAEAGVDYKAALAEGGYVLETVFAIWANVLEFYENGKVINGAAAADRAWQYLRQYRDKSYVVDPPWKPWEVELHGP